MEKYLELLHKILDIEYQGYSSTNFIIRKLIERKYGKLNYISTIKKNRLASSDYHFVNDTLNNKLIFFKVFDFKGGTSVKLELKEDFSEIAKQFERVVNLDLILINSTNSIEYYKDESILWWIYGTDQKEKINVSVKILQLHDLHNFFLSSSDLTNDILFDFSKYDSPSFKYENYAKISYLKQKFYKKKLTLFLGAGISKESGLPTWNELLKRLREKNNDELLAKCGIGVNTESGKRIIQQLSETLIEQPIIEASIYENSLGKETINYLLKDILYNNEYRLNKTLNSIAEFSKSVGSGYFIENIITYNYDDLLEKTIIDSRGLKQTFPNIITNSKDIIKSSDDSINIFHVHGYLSRFDKQNDFPIILSDGSYNELYNRFNHWSNLIQLKYLMSSTCLFIGHSGNDPNLRRLLSSIKTVQNEKHFIIYKRFRKVDDDNINDEFNMLYEKQFNELGLEVIWIDDFADLDNILAEIKY